MTSIEDEWEAIAAFVRGICPAVEQTLDRDADVQLDVQREQDGSPVGQIKRIEPGVWQVTHYNYS